MNTMTNVIGVAPTSYINVYNNGNLGLPIVANIPYTNNSKVLEIYGNCPNHTIEYTNYKRVTSWVIS
jgi:hypothetical protein